MSQLKKGDRVTVKVDGRPAFNGTIVGEGRLGPWWAVMKDGNQYADSYHKDFCRPEAESVSNGDR